MVCESSGWDQAVESSRTLMKFNQDVDRLLESSPEHPEVDRRVGWHFLVHFALNKRFNLTLSLVKHQKVVEFSQSHRALSTAFSVKNLQVKDRPSTTKLQVSYQVIDCVERYFSDFDLI